MDQLRECYRSLTEDSHKMKMMYESQCEELNKVTYGIFVKFCSYQVIFDS